MGERRYTTADFDYGLPEERIAQRPADRRDESRLLLLDRARGALDHRRFRDIVDLIPPGDALVLNETRVLPARLIGRKPTGAAGEVLLLRPAPSPGRRPGPSSTEYWYALVRPGGKLKPGRVLVIDDDLSVEIVDSTPGGGRIVRLVTSRAPREAIARAGRMPLPPYIDRDADAEDRRRYQTVYARAEGSVAAPTAGLHFTPALIDDIEERGVRIVRIVLHVGVGTFRPVEVEDPADHRMHAEEYAVAEEAAATLNEVRDAGGSVWAVGTTVVRTLETVADETSGRIRSGAGWTRTFIRPPYRFRAVDRLITNFHLPRSTLLMLVSAFAGHELVMRAYREAVERRYRFYSYGDAMAIV